MPIAIVKNIHLDTINDIAWMGDSLIIVASSDGFCSFIQLQKDLVGERLETDSTFIPDKMKEFYKKANAIIYDVKGILKNPDGKL